MHNTENFKFKEFECKCGCGRNEISPVLMNKLQDVRTAFGKPMIINSGFRCVEHNKEIGGVLNSAHCEGLAVDIQCINPIDRYKLLHLLMTFGFRRIGVYKTFIHADIRTSENAVMWIGN